jgi:hypothetical protein
MKLKLITESVFETKSLIEESNDGNKDYYIVGKYLVSEEVNGNKRKYSKELLEREVGRYTKEYIDKHRAVGELGHPDGPKINEDRISHKIVQLEQDGNIWHGKAKLLNTPPGNFARNLIEGGVVMGVSSRALGSLKSVNGINEVQSDLHLITAADIVADPSAPGAFVQGIMEGKEWVWDNGMVKEATINNYKNQIKKASAKELDSVALIVFENMMFKIGKG